MTGYHGDDHTILAPFALVFLFCLSYRDVMVVVVVVLDVGAPCNIRQTVRVVRGVYILINKPPVISSKATSALTGATS